MFVFVIWFNAVEGEGYKRCKKRGGPSGRSGGGDYGDVDRKAEVKNAHVKQGQTIGDTED